MSTSRQDIAQVIVERIDQMPLPELAEQLAAYLITQRRTHELESIMRDVDILRSSGGSFEADISSAHVLDENNLTAVENLIKNHNPHARQINLNTAIDFKLIGGLKIELTGEELDLSIRAKVNQLKRTISEGLA